MRNFIGKLASLGGIAFIAATVGCVSMREGANEYMSDAAISGKVRTAISSEPALNSSEISVATSKGVVQLSGYVSSPANGATASKIAGEVEGVKSVTNEMQSFRPRWNSDSYLPGA